MVAPVFVLAPAAGVQLLTASGLSGAGAIMSHLQQNADPGTFADASRLLDTMRPSGSSSP
jgi:hypothetical protein